MRRRLLLRSIAASVHGAVDPTALRAEGADPTMLIDFSSNQSPMGAAPGVAAAVAGAVVDAYPDPRASALTEVLAQRHGLSPEQVIVANGSTELIRLIAQLALGPGDTALSLAPSFGEYAVATQLAGARFLEVRLRHRGAGEGFFCDESALLAALAELRPRLCWLCSPNNPTGATLPAEFLASLVTGHRDTLFVFDEAYCDLLTAPQWGPEVLAAGNLVVLRSMTKYWGLAGLRLGYALTDPSLARLLRAAAPPWSVNACAQAAGAVALADHRHLSLSIARLVEERDRLVTELRRSGWTVEPTSAGFFLVEVENASATRSALLVHGCLVRDCTSFGLPTFVRISPRRVDHNDLLLSAFNAFVGKEGER